MSDNEYENPVDEYRQEEYQPQVDDEQEQQQQQQYEDEEQPQQQQQEEEEEQQQPQQQEEEEEPQQEQQQQQPEASYHHSITKSQPPRAQQYRQADSDDAKEPVEKAAPAKKKKEEEEQEEQLAPPKSTYSHGKTYSMFDKPIPTNLTLDSAWKEICVDAPAINWYLFSVDKKMDLNFRGAGQKGFQEITDILKKSSTELLFGLLRINSNDKGGSKRAKFVYVRFVGSAVGVMQKAKITPKLGKIGDSFPVKHMTYDLTEDLSNFTIETISKEMLRVGGAHKPDSFEFGPEQIFYCK